MKVILFIFFLFSVQVLYCQKLVYIPDPAFRKWLQEQYPGAMVGDSGAYLNAKDKRISKTKSIVVEKRGIKDLSGIEVFKNLELFSFEHNEVKVFPKLKLKKIRWISCGNNLLQELPDLSGSKKLYKLGCDSNQLTKLPELSKLTELEELVCSNNSLLSLPSLNKLTKLQRLKCGYNQFKELPDLSANISLIVLDADHNNLNQLPDFNKLTKLVYINLNFNELTMFPTLREGLIIKQLGLSHNKLNVLPNLDLLTELSSLHIDHNEFTAIPNLIGNKKLDWLNISHNQIKEIPKVFCSSSVELDLSFNFIEDLEPLRFSHVGKLNISGNPLKTFPKDMRVTKLVMDSMSFAVWPDLSALQLSDFSCCYNHLKTLPNVSLVGMRKLTVHHNQLTQIPNLEKAGELVSLDISHNNFKQLNNFPDRLREVNCTDNPWKKRPAFPILKLKEWEDPDIDKVKCDCCE